MSLSLSMTHLILIWRVSAQWSSQTWTIAHYIFMGIRIVQTNTGEVILLRLQIWWGKTCFLPGESLILLMPSKNPKYLWMWYSTKRGIFIHRMFRNHYNWLLRYDIVFVTRGIWRGHHSPSRLCMTWLLYWNYVNNCNYLLKEVWKRNRLQSLSLPT